MNFSTKSSTSPSGVTERSTTPSKDPPISFLIETQSSSSSLYDSVLDNLSAYTTSSSSHHHESANGNTNNTSVVNPKMNSTTDFDATFNESIASLNDVRVHVRDCDMMQHSNINSSMLLIQSESSETNTSQDEVNPKSQLANKTIFKTDNPNLSIIEINCNNSIKEEELENSIVLIESTPPSSVAYSDDYNSDGGDNGNNEKTEQRKLNQKWKKSQCKSLTFVENSTEKRRKKAETLIHSSKQKLNIAIAEASAAESNKQMVTAVGGAAGDATAIHSTDYQQQQQAQQQQSQVDTKREIRVYDTIEEFEKNLPSTVTILDTPFGSKVYLVGTAHFSEDSKDDVSYVIRNVRPDVVMVELCPSRIHILKLDEKTLLEEAKNFNLAKIRGIIQAHGYINGIFFILLLQMSAQIAKDLGMAPGGEFRRAFEEMHKLPGCELHLGDRPVRITLHRALRALSAWQLLKLVWRLTSADSISIEEVEECKQRDLLEKLMQEMAGEFPAYSDVFVKERDLFLCHSLQMAALPQAVTSGGGTVPRPVRVVGVVGIGHANGIAQMWGRVDPQKIPAIMEIPPASTSTRICKYTIKYGLIGITLFGVFKLLRPRFTRLF